MDAIIIGRRNGSIIPITPTPEFNKANVIWPLEPLAMVATTVATIAPEPSPAIILEIITKFNSGANIVKKFPLITNKEAIKNIFFLLILLTNLDKIIDEIEINKVSKVAIKPTWPLVASTNFSDIAIIFKGIISGDEKAHRSKPIRPI